uniref:Tripartite motif containing 10 n=1 Tax=Pelodiscus sinensis TaxID=13735 RepID=K7FP86_PELSI
MFFLWFFFQKQTQVERQKIVAEFQQLRQFLEEQERLLLAQLQKMDEEIVRLQTDTVTKLSAQISRLSQVIGELEGKCQKPGSEFLQQGHHGTLFLPSCEKGQAQRPEEMAPELEERVRGFSQKVIVLLETLREFKGNISLMTSARLARLKLSQSPSIRWSVGRGKTPGSHCPTPQRDLTLAPVCWAVRASPWGDITGRRRWGMGDTGLWGWPESLPRAGSGLWGGAGVSSRLSLTLRTPYPCAPPA